jgi:signal transduction histidine kinase
MDIRLHGTMDGVEAAFEIRKRFGIPVTYLTAFADEQTLTRAQDTAPYGYLVKPFDERELHATIQTALRRHQVEQQVELKADLIAAVSHELRTSFGTIVGFTELLLNGEYGPLTPEQAEHLHSMEESLQQMLELIRSSLDFSRLERQGTVLDVRHTRIADLVAALERELRDFPRATGVRLEWSVAPELPAIRTDPVKLQLIIRNLIVNALKYTEHGSVRLTTRSLEGEVEFIVSDTGPGIAPEAQEAIFEPFHCLGGARATAVGGLGLGLYITRRMVGLLGGSISLESVLGRGSDFRVRIPHQSPASTSRTNG